MFKRKIYNKLKAWKAESEGKTALLIEGARRVGKSTLVEEFAKKEYKSYILIDFTIVPKSIKDLFDDISDLDYIFLQLQLQFKVDLFERDSLIIFDEVQSCPNARQAIKSLVQDHRYDYIETGSLISIKRNVKDILIPSEERKINMYPMDYEEFCMAKGDSTTTELLKEVFQKKKSLGDQLNRKLMRDFRLYMLVGGMPQSIEEYLNSNSFSKVDEVKRDILDLYESDLKKIDPSGKASSLFRSIPAQLTGNASRYQVSSVLEHERASSIAELITQMQDSKTILVSYHSNDPNIGLPGSINMSKFKIFLADTGLFTTLMFNNRDFTENVVYEKLLNDKSNANLGYLYENIVAQTLSANGHELFYNTIFNNSTRRNYEIDFLITSNNKICPIEVKSSGYKKHSSLDAFGAKFSNRIKEKYLIYTKDLARMDDVTYLPVYLTQFL